MKYLCCRKRQKSLFATVECLDNWCSGRNFGIYVWLVKTQDYSTNPKSLLIIGLIFASAGIALVSVGASLSSTEPQGFSTSPQTGDSSLVARDDEGVPIEGIRPSDKAEVDCNADLQDHNAYREYAYHAEFEMYGNHIANLSISEAKEILGGATSRIRACILLGPSHKYN